MRKICCFKHPRLAASILFALGASILVAGLFIPTLDAAPAAQATSFTFTAVGDLGGTANTDGVLTGIANAGANFQLTLGDLSYGSYAPETAWCSYVQSKVGATFPFELVSGNHDMDGQPTGHINNFAACLPDRIGNLTGAYGKQYYFDYQNLARIIFISPNLVLDGEAYTYTVGSARYNWLASAIDDARAANIPWVIVAMHKNCITTGVKSCEIGTDLFNLLVAKKVDLVLQGHDHNYQRSKQLAFNATCTAITPNQYDAPCVIDDGADNVYTKSAGMVLAIVGTGGLSLYGSNPADSEANYFARIAVPGVDVARYGFLQVNVTSSTLSAQFVGTSSGSTFSDAFVISSGPLPPTPTPSPTPNKTTLIAQGATWKYLDNGSDQGAAWRNPGFDDTTWRSGAAELGYGDGDETTTVRYGPDANNKYATTYFRKTFTVANPAFISALTASLKRDDGAVVYVNGVEVARSNMPAGAIAYNTFASTTISGAAETTWLNFDVSAAPLQKANRRAPTLTNGANVLAVEIHQVTGESSDISFDLALTAINAPTTTLLSTFTGRAVKGPRVRLNWTTTDETALVGFNVWRSRRAHGVFEKINPVRLPAQFIGQPYGARYHWRDQRVISGARYFYKLELVRSDNTAEWSNVIKVKTP
ncbi:MAG: metallophosphoesterase [Chloroflexi bacterium]|nr:metallophosphoesterase [Chloroflexota bacterium]